jgi:hypothetical protein
VEAGLGEHDSKGQTNVTQTANDANPGLVWIHVRLDGRTSEEI